MARKKLAVENPQPVNACQSSDSEQTRLARIVIAAVYWQAKVTTLGVIQRERDENRLVLDCESAERLVRFAGENFGAAESTCLASLIETVFSADGRPRDFTTELTRQALRGSLERLRKEADRQLHKVSPDEAAWLEKLDAYLLTLPKHTREALTEAIDRLRSEERPLTGPEIFGPRAEQKKLNTLASAKTTGILGNDRSTGYFLPHWPPEKIVRLK
jgi:hypothetical protein